MRAVLLICILSISLFAKAEESCYTVQLVSSSNNEVFLNQLQSKNYPESCKLMKIGKNLAVRCGCFDRYADAQVHKQEFSKYKDAKLVKTYKHRFSKQAEKEGIKSVNINKLKGTKKSKARTINDRPKSQRDEELRLILQVFLYKGDLEHAYKVGLLGYNLNPESYYWNQKMAEISKWTNRGARSMKYLRFMYDVTHDAKIEAELITYGESAYQYEEILPLVVNRAIVNPSEKNIDLMILVYKKVGLPEEVVKILEAQYMNNKTKTLLLTKALDLSLEMGDLVLAQKYVSMIEDSKPYSKIDATLIARYYYIKQDIQAAYMSMTDVKEDENISSDKLKAYYQLKSDFAWYLQKNDEAAAVSYKLFDMNETRLSDYERVSYVYQNKYPDIALLSSQRAYKDFKLSYIFYSYAQAALNNNEYANVQIFLNQIDAKEGPLTREALYWLIKAKVYQYNEEYELEESALIIAYGLEPKNFQIKQELLWSYMEVKDYVSISNILTDMIESDNLEVNQYMTIANAYLFLNDVNWASFYTQELLAQEHEVTKSLEFKFLQAYIYQMQSEEHRFRKSMKEIVNILEIKAREKPKLKQENKFLSDYLRAGMYIFNPDKFEKKLKLAKQFLTSQNYDDISYSWAIQNNAFDKSFKIYHRMKKRELWADFSNALLRQDSTKINNILDIYLHSIAKGDASVAANDDGQVSLAQSITYEELYTNNKSLNAYVLHLELSKKRSDKFDTTMSYFKRNPLLQKYISLHDSSYLGDGYYLDLGINYFLNESIDKSVLINVPYSTVNVEVAMRKLYNRGELTLHTAYHDSVESYIEFGIGGEYQLLSTLRVGASLINNMNTLETIPLILGGKKDMIDFHLSWNILNSTIVSLRREYNQYLSQDNVNLGSGTFDSISISRQIRNGYPDLKIGMFYDNASYSETLGSRGVVDTLQPGDFRALPNNFYNIGLTMAYGTANKNLYTRVWRPYFEFSPFYNNDIDSMTFTINTGYGGKIWHQDHLVFGMSYAESVNGVGGSVLELFINYKFMYYHP